MAKTELSTWLTDQQAHFNKTVLPRYLPPADSALHRGMIYATQNGGKRLRPLLVYAAGQSVDANPVHLDLAAAAIELIHCYSLVHDDLPAMDDDDWRRGQPSCHKAFDEATAILVGDALQSRAFELLSREPLPNQVKLIHTLATASGSMGMAGGQALDVAASHGTVSLNELQTIHQLKTSALLTAALQLGATVADLPASEFEQLTTLGHHLGMAFQIRDDLRDILCSSEELGKTAGLDQAHQKATFPAVLGLEATQRAFETTLNQAIAIARGRPQADALLSIVRLIQPD